LHLLKSITERHVCEIKRAQNPQAEGILSEIATVAVTVRREWFPSDRTTCTMPGMHRRFKRSAFLAVTGGAIAVTFLLPRYDLPPTYHDFADRRMLFGVENFADVASNIGFFVAGLYGIAVTLWRRWGFEDQRELPAYIVLFGGLVLTAFGSGYYHLRPDDARLLWDRLPITVAFMGLFAAMISERLSVPVGFRLLPLLVCCGGASLWYWMWTVETGNRDLRPYILVQFYPLLAILLLLWMFEPRYTRGYDFLIALAFYIAAKVFEVADKPVYAATGNVISGHTLKHLSAGVGGYWLARMLASRERLRKPIASSAVAAP